MLILVTGGTGFVGSAVVRRLLAEGYSVRVLVRTGSNLRNLDGLPVELVKGDLIDRHSLRHAVKDTVGVFHVAADYRLWVHNPETMNLVNVVGSQNLLRAAADAGVRRIVYTSSVATLGYTRAGIPADETTPSFLTDMIGYYKRSKFLAELEVKRLALEERIPVIIVNPSTPVGPRDIKPTPTGRLILKAASGLIPAYVDTGLNIVHVDDVASGHWLAWSYGQVGERYILGGDNMNLYDVLTIIATIVNGRPPRIQLHCNIVMPFAIISEALAYLFRKEPFITVDGVRMARKKMFFSSEKAHRILGYTYRPAVEGLHDAVSWFRAEGYL